MAINFNIDFGLMGKRLTPPNKRGASHLAWIRSFLSPLQFLNQSFFNVFFPDVKLRARRTGQKIILENTLNQEFNPDQTSSLIFISNNQGAVNIEFIYNESELIEIDYFDNESEGNPVFISNLSEIVSSSSFTVFVPSFVLNNFTEGAIAAEVDRYRPVGSTYNIVIY